MGKTVSVKRRGSNPRLDTDVSEAIGHADGNETGLGRPFGLFADTPLRLRPVMTRRKSRSCESCFMRRVPQAVDAVEDSGEYGAWQRGFCLPLSRATSLSRRRMPSATPIVFFGLSMGIRARRCNCGQLQVSVPNR